MTKAKKYFVLALSIGLLGLTEAVSGFVLWLGFPVGAGGGGRHGWGGGGGIGELTYWGISKHTWTDIHDWVAIALVVLVIIHVILHWRWIVRMARSLFKGASQKLTICPSRT